MLEPTREFSLHVNDQVRTVRASPSSALLYVLRNDCGLNGPKYGCGLGQCGSCSVLLDGVVTRSCVTPLKVVGRREVTTLEGLGSADSLGIVQQAFVEAQAAQCGYCINGMIMTAHALLLRNPSPTDAEIRSELEYNLCRCGTHLEILRAVRLAADMLARQQTA